MTPKRTARGHAAAVARIAAIPRIATIVVIAGSLAADPSVAQRRQRLDLVRLSIELPGIPAAVIPADLDGDGRGDLVVVLAYTEWSQISFSEEVEIDEVADVVEMMTVVPSLADRRELLVYRGLPGGGFEGAGAPWPLPRGVLGVEPGPPEQPVLVLHDGGAAALRIPMEGGAEPRLEPVVEVRSVLSGSRSLLPQLGLTPDVDGDGERDLLVPRRDDVAVYLSHAGRIEPRLAGTIALPPRGRTGPAVGRVRSLPLPELRDVDGDRLPDALFLHPNASYERFWVARGRGGGAQVDPLIAPVGEWGDRREELLSELELGTGRSVELDDLQVAWFGDLDGDGVAEYVLAEDLSDDEAGMRKGMKQAKNPPFRYRVLPSGADLSPAGEVRTTFEGLGYAFAGDEEIRLPGGFQDLDGDGRQDLVTITLDFSIFQAVRVLATRSLSIGMDFRVWCQQEDGGFRPVAGVDLSGKFKLDLDDLRLGQLSMFAGDFDGDGRADFVQMGRGRRVSIHRGESGCAYAERPDLVVELREEPRNLALVRVEDLDGDRLADLLVVQPLPWPRDGATQPVRLDLYVSGGASE
ncbi:MAG TPA: VCBS repeat-containing protein [Thermoanaerobaculia bacterium]|nr:VCBS repeat-containing protein [Thermoanaerobaculia bacterium]